MKCEACGRESEELRQPPRKMHSCFRQTEPLLCEECIEPCMCKGGFRANCTCDYEYEQERERRWGL